jgi:hypothetical protein
VSAPSGSKAIIAALSANLSIAALKVGAFAPYRLGVHAG